MDFPIETKSHAFRLQPAKATSTWRPVDFSYLLRAYIPDSPPSLCSCRRLPQSLAMDPNPRTFPILSYVMSRLHPTPPPDDSFDIEQPPPVAGDQLVEQMPHLKHPDLLSSMARAVTEVAGTRNALRALGERPDHETVDAARARVAAIDAALSHQLDEIARAPCPDGVDLLHWRSDQAKREKECRDVADEERRACRAVINVDEMHEAYGRLLKDAEERLVRMYGSAADGGGSDNVNDEQINEEVIGILQQAAGSSLERIDVSDRRLKFLPEAFGRMRGLVSLNISNNLLKVIPDSIAGLELLEELRASSNLLVSLPDSIGLLLNLKILDVSSNQLTALPDSISNCRSLVELDASYNSLEYLPTNIGYGLVNLQKLRVYLNKIRSLPTSVGEMRSLCVLDAHFNELHGVPYAIGKLTNLETLNLSSNFSDLKELPASIGELTNLKELDLSNNQIHVLPQTFGRLDKLIKLNLEQNPLVIPPAEIVKEGVEAVKEYMEKRWTDILAEEERKSQLVEENTTPKAGWLTRSTSWLNNFATGLSGSVAGYLYAGGKSEIDPYLEQQL